MEESSWYQACYLDEIHSLNKLLPPTNMPKSEKWQQRISGTCFGVLNSNTLVLVIDTKLAISQIEKHSTHVLDTNITGTYSIAVPPRNFFTEQIDGKNYSQFAFMHRQKLVLYNWKTLKTIKSIEGNSHLSDCQKNLLYLTKQHCISTKNSKVAVWDFIEECEYDVLTESVQIMCLENIGNGKIATGAMGGTVRIYQAIESDHVLPHFKLLHTLQIPEGSSYGVLCMCLVDQYTIAASGWTQKIHVWDLRTKECTFTSAPHNTKNVKFLLSLGDGHLASCARDGHINIWDVRQGRHLSRLEGHKKDVLYLGMLGDKTLLSASDDKTLRAWTIMSNEKMVTRMFDKLRQMVGVESFSDIIVT
jgi:WD40 repeat protein